MSLLDDIAREMGGEVKGDRACFPTPDHSERDRGSWASLAPDAPDGVLIHCSNGGNPLEIKDRLRAAGILAPREVQEATGPGPWTWTYTDADGRPVRRKVWLGKPGQKYAWQSPDSTGEWIWKKGAAPVVPYRLGDILAADPSAAIYTTEGEKHTDKLASWGLLATSHRDDVGCLAPYVSGRRVFILPDNDKAGEEYAAKAETVVRKAGGEPQIVRLPSLPVGGDILDWDGSRADLIELTEAARADRERDRRAAQRSENVAIGEGSSAVPLARIYSVDEMLDQFVLIKDGSQVAPLDRPQGVLALSDFRNALAGSKHWFETEGRRKARPAVNAWLEHPARKEAETLTFRAGGQRMTCAPNTGKSALNLWAPIARSEPPADGQARAARFVGHVEWLWGDDAGPFLDWLAHIEQHPGVLPHYGWVHISREHGKGRNWISSVLTRLWPGYVAASLDLLSILDGGFNGRMARKLLAIVDEINEGGSASYRHAQSLRQIVTAEHREINPKYGRQYVEYNACRWLMFSNHTGALPLSEDDRRFWIVSHQGAPKGLEYYADLYRDLDDPLFIASIAELLARRDLSHFKPGERPPLNAAKAELIAFSQTEDDATLKAVVAHWPVDLITAYELTNLLEDGGPSKPAVRHALDRAGFRKLDRKVKISGQGAQRVYVVRNFAVWANAAHHACKAHIEKEPVRTLPEPENDV